MNSSSTSGATSVERPAEETIPLFGEDALAELQLRIARRADELVRAQHLGNGLHRHYWLLAEAEMIREFWTAAFAEGERLASWDKSLSP